MGVVRHEHIAAYGYTISLCSKAEEAKRLVNFGAREQRETLVSIKCYKVKDAQMRKNRAELWRAARIFAVWLVGHERFCKRTACYSIC